TLKLPALRILSPHSMIYYSMPDGDRELRLQLQGSKGSSEELGSGLSGEAELAVCTSRKTSYDGTTVPEHTTYNPAPMSSIALPYTPAPLSSLAGSTVTGNSR